MRQQKRINDMIKYKSVLITGASSGIGKALAYRYLEMGARVGICGRNEKRIADVCADHPRAYPLKFDTTDQEAVDAAFQEFTRLAGPMDLAILNAGDHRATDGVSFSASEYEHLMNVNYVGTLNCLEPSISIMREQKTGTIAIMGSVAGYKGLPNAGAYCASKAALMRLAETLRTELAIVGIDVRLISPGFVKTPLTAQNEFPMPFLMEVDDAADRVVNGLSKKRFEIAFPRRLAWPLRLLSMVPASLYFSVTKNILPDKRKI